jgi:hypothetical protein
MEKSGMTREMTVTASDLYNRVVEAFVSDPSLEAALLADVGATVSERFGIALPKPATLVRSGSGFRLSYDGQDYDLGDPRQQTKGELNDAELELVSGGGNCDSGAIEIDDSGKLLNPGSEGRAR